MIAQVVPSEAARALEETPDALYLDVRTPEEFAAGHPAGALNVPFAFFDPSRRLTPNADFEHVVRAVVPTGRKVLVGCQSGGRSAQACALLGRLGYGDVANVVGGFGGGRDAAGRPVRGWKDAGLPVETEAPGRTWEELRRKS